MIKKKRKKRSAKAIAKDKAWDACSEYIRRKFAVDGYTTCVTCGVTKPWKEMQAGHYVDGRNNTVLFMEEIIYPQCFSCNMGKKGNKIKYTAFMMRKGYTMDELDTLDNLKFGIKKMSTNDFKEKEEYFLTKLNQLKPN